MSNNNFIKVLLDENATICEFECTISDICYSSEEVIGKSWFDLFINSSDNEKVMNVFKSLLETDDEKYSTYTNDIKFKNANHILIDFKNSIEIKDGKKYILSVGIEHYLN